LAPRLSLGTLPVRRMGASTMSTRGPMRRATRSAKAAEVSHPLFCAFTFPYLFPLYHLISVHKGNNLKLGVRVVFAVGLGVRGEARESGAEMGRTHRLLYE
jgi:hypothetical protein